MRNQTRHGRLARLLAAGAATAALAAAVVGCGSGSDSGGDTTGGGSGGGDKLTLVAYSTPREVYEAAIPAFQATPDGTGVTFEQSYGSSGEQSRAVEAGLPASIVALSLEPDVTRLVDGGLVAADWNSGPLKGMVSDSVVVFMVRKGNPKDITTWADLTKPGVEVITPNPFTSGGAQWNLMAAYGAQIEQGKTPEEATQYLARLLKNVSVQDKSAREALQTFTSGKGDVLLAYENEAILAQRNGEDVDYIVPGQTILIENPIAVTTGAPASAATFVAFMQSPAGQRIFGEKGYRPVLPSVAAEFDYPKPSGLFTIEELGGWSAVRKRFFDRDSGIVAKLYADQGIPTQ